MGGSSRQMWRRQMRWEVGRKRSERKKGGTCDGGLQRWRIVAVLVTCGVSISDLHTQRERERERERARVT